MATFACYMSAQLELSGVAYTLEPACRQALHNAVSKLCCGGTCAHLHCARCLAAPKTQCLPSVQQPSWPGITLPTASLVPMPQTALFPNAQLCWASATRQPDLSLLSALSGFAITLAVEPAVGSADFQRAHRAVSGRAQGWAATEGAARQLELRQRGAGLDVLLTVSATRRLVLLLHAYGVSKSVAASGASAQPPGKLAAAVQSCAGLVALEPGNARLLWRSALALGWAGCSAQAAVMHRKALAAADESKGEVPSLRQRDFVWAGCYLARV